MGHGRRFEVVLEPHCDLTLIEVHGDLDLLTAPKLTTALSRPIRCGSAPLVIDLSQVASMATVGLHVLLTTRRQLERRDRRLVVIAPPGPARRIIDQAALVAALNVHFSLPEARRSLLSVV